jgi:hypothetical protein
MAAPLAPLVLRERMAESLKQAYARHGHDAFEDAYCAFLYEVQKCGNRPLWLRLMNSNDIGEALVQWRRMNSEDEETWCHG